MLPLDHHLTSPNKEDPTAMMLYYSDEKVDFLIHKQKLVFLGFYAVLEMTIDNKYYQVVYTLKRKQASYCSNATRLLVVALSLQRSLDLFPGR